MNPLIVLTEGRTDPLAAKTAVALLRYRGDEVAALIDSQNAGATAGPLLGIGGDTPIVASVADAAARLSDAKGHLIVGVATPGGGLPPAMRAAVLDAAHRGWDVTSGLHQFLRDDEELAAAAAASGATLTDLRRNAERVIADRRGLRGLDASGGGGGGGGDCLRLHTVGQDCSCGKMVASVELTRGLQAAGHDAKFVPTGQTGMLVAPGINAGLTLTDEERADPTGGGVGIDAVVGDFLNGAAERLVKRNQHHDILVIEGQATLVHPSYSSVTYGLLHGCLPHGLILCYEPGRPHMLGRPHLPLTPLDTVRRLYDHVSNLEQECQFIGVAMSSRLLKDDAAVEEERDRVGNLLGLPVCDVYCEGPGVLVNAALALKRETTKSE